jgi:RimJ/RimL family protein N-acetyltransferase
MYPRTEIVQDEREIELWPMAADDAPALLAFYRSLPPEDLLYLREDVTKPEAMDRWVEGIESGQVWHLLAGYRGRIIADGELDYPYYGWSQHVGELRIVVDRAFRGSGLSALVMQELLNLATEEGLQKVFVQIMVNQHAAIQLCKRLGFRCEAVLTKHVQDQDGEFRDLMIMTYFINNFHDAWENQSQHGVDPTS